MHTDRPAVLFDLDGTLIDSVYQHVLAWKESLASAGIKTLDLAHPPADRHERWALRARARPRDGS
jgi:beta-phosphoglucomutase-like phosphatase (HAD superfamily)